MRLSHRILAAAILGCSLVAATAPVSAQPLEIVVPGGNRPDPAPAPGGVLPRSTIFSYNEALPFDFDFDPGEAAFNSQIFNRTVTGPNMVRARVLEAHSSSLTEHQLRCQAMHPTYELSGDTYLGPDGLPRPCTY